MASIYPSEAPKPLTIASIKLYPFSMFKTVLPGTAQFVVIEW